MKKTSRVPERTIGALGMGWFLGAMAVSMGVEHPSSLVIALLGMVLGFLIGGETSKKECAE